LPLPSADLAGDPPDCVSAWRLPATVSLWGFEPGFQLVRGALPLIGIGRNRYFAKKGGRRAFARRGAFLQTIELGRRYQAVVLG